MSKLFIIVGLMLGFTSSVMANFSGKGILQHTKKAVAIRSYSVIPFAKLKGFSSTSFQFRYELDEHDENTVTRLGVYIIQKEDGSYEFRQLFNKDGTVDKETPLVGNFAYEGDGAILQWTELDGAEIKIKMDGIPDEPPMDSDEWAITVEVEKKDPNGNDIVTLQGEMKYFQISAGG